MYTGTLITQLDRLVTEAWIRQSRKFWAEVDPFQYAKPCWQRRQWRVDGEEQ